MTASADRPTNVLGGDVKLDRISKMISSSSSQNKMLNYFILKNDNNSNPLGKL